MPSLDYSLVKRVKLGDRAASLTLFQKYDRLIKNRSRIAESPIDFKQTAFEIMIAAVNKVDLSRIPDPNTWGFYFMFSMDLLKGALKQNKEEYRSKIDPAPYPLEAYLGESNIDGSGPRDRSSASLPSQVVSSELNRYLPQNEAIRIRSASIAESFMKTCTPIERKLIILVGQDIKLISCAEQLGISYGSTRMMMRSLRHRAEQFVERATYTTPEIHMRYKKSHGYHPITNEERA